MDVTTGVRESAAHAARLEPYLRPLLERRARGQKHPVTDFLFSYYSLTPAQLRRWHPGLGVVLTGPLAAQRRGWRFYRELECSAAPAPDVAVTVDGALFAAERGATVEYVRSLVAATATRAPRFECFGLHEWAMVYRADKAQRRHDYLHLRLGADATDAVVETSKLRCTHVDAFRFYTPEAVPHNEFAPTRDNQIRDEQPGCLHAGMDLYKWAYKLGPLIPGELLLDCFELAWRIREVDMRASPYDLTAWGYAPIPIETAAGKAEYVELQRDFTTAAQQLRAALLAVIEGFRTSGYTSA